MQRRLQVATSKLEESYLLGGIGYTVAIHIGGSGYLPQVVTGGELPEFTACPPFEGEEVIPRCGQYVLCTVGVEVSRFEVERGCLLPRPHNVVDEHFLAGNEVPHLRSCCGVVAAQVGEVRVVGSQDQARPETAIQKGDVTHRLGRRDSVGQLAPGYHVQAVGGAYKDLLLAISIHFRREDVRGDAAEEPDLQTADGWGGFCGAETPQPLGGGDPVYGGGHVHTEQPVRSGETCRNDSHQTGYLAAKAQSRQSLSSMNKFSMLEASWHYNQTQVCVQKRVLGER